ncbi:hypothetical protein KFE25_011938 [Diacronema lutheri]|uniref:Uncharacterized protein n=2 Tax=Diacronema lutheri TaxID=2081491 RepID=A0A8J5X5L6_DIALT|nr:hypothetical protein KFE25_011938 [Diacronema lutheri]
MAPSLPHGAIALDIGGSLIKAAVFCARGRELARAPLSDVRVPPLAGRPAVHPPLELSSFGGAVHFGAVDASAIGACIESVAAHCGASARDARVRMPATGGGATKHAPDFAAAGIELQPRAEIDAMACGLEGTLMHGSSEGEAFELHTGDPLEPCPPSRAATLARRYVLLRAPPPSPPPRIYPYLLASLGSGMSVVLVHGPQAAERERVGGSSIAGGTFNHLGRMVAALAHARAEGGEGGGSACAVGCDPATARARAPLGYEALLDLAERGDASRADVTVGDIYGPNGCAALSLPPSVPAASLGRADAGGVRAPRAADLAQSLLWMVAWNGAQLAALDARRLNVRDIFFTGGLAAGRAYPMAVLSNSVRFNSAGSARALFVRRDGCLGALGALLMSEKARDEWR